VYTLTAFETSPLPVGLTVDRPEHVAFSCSCPSFGTPDAIVQHDAQQRHVDLIFGLCYGRPPQRGLSILPHRIAVHDERYLGQGHHARYANTSTLGDTEKSSQSGAARVGAEIKMNKGRKWLLLAIFSLAQVGALVLYQHQI
jgi:hypothetical protein